MGTQRPELGNDTRKELDDALKNMLVVASENGLSKRGRVRLEELLTTFRDVFCVRLGAGPPADVEPMVVEIKEGSVPYIAKARRYPAEQRDYMRSFLDQFVEFGMAKRNENAEWAAPPLLIPKPGTTKYRLKFDLRRVNQCTKPMVWPMPYLQSELLDFAGSTMFASIDLGAGYW